MLYLSEFDCPGSGWADHYEAQPYGNFKYEVYPLMTRILATLPDGARVLDIGAGTGHLAAEFVRAHPGRALAFTLLDNSSAMLAIAARKLAGLGCTPPAQMLHRSAHADDALGGIGRFAMIVGNNTPYPTAAPDLIAYYRRMADILAPGGAILMQQPFTLDEGGSIYHHDHPFARLLAGDHPQLRENPPVTAEEAAHQAAAKDAAKRRHQDAVAAAKAAGDAIAQPQWGWNHTTVQAHLDALRSIGMPATTIWRKRNYAVILAVLPETAAAGTA